MIRNLMFHIYPKLGAEWNWHRHIRNICRVAHLFDGKICIGVATGDGLAPQQCVRDLLSAVSVTDWVIRENSGLAEMTTFEDMLLCVSEADPESITFRGHTKGVTHSPTGFEQSWATFMWATSMCISEVEHLLKSWVMAGPLKCRVGIDSWFYAGTFFWFRNADIFSRDWRRMDWSRWYPEVWPSVVVKDGEAACLCHGFRDGSTLSPAYWASVVMPAFEEWKSEKRDLIGGLE